MKTLKTCKSGCGKMKEGGSAGCPPGQCPKYVGGKREGCKPCSGGIIAGITAGISGIAGVAGKMISDAAKKRKAIKELKKSNPAMTTKEARQKLASKDTEEKRKGGSVKKYANGGSMITGMPQYGNNPRTYSGRMLKEGGSFAPNRAVQASCKNGMVRDANGKCVMSKSFKKGGFPDLNKDGKITKADILKGRGVIKKLGGAKKK